jgi:ribosomal protein L16 Arg81 hydroxylase
MFIGGKGTIVPLHYDFMYDDGLLTQLFGRKEIILIEPSQSKYLYRIPFNSTSMMNLFDPKEKEYPALKNIRAYRVMLEHGDTIFIPSGYWHQMTYVDASLSIGFRKWHRNPLVTFKTGLVRLTQIPFDKSLSLIFGKYWFNWKVNHTKRLEKVT